MAVSDGNAAAIVQNTYGQAPVQSINAQSTVQNGAAYDGLVTRTVACMVVVSSTGVTAGSVQMQGSLDGTNWYNLGSAVSTTTASTVFAPVIVNATAFRLLRAAIVTLISGGTISASVACSG